MHIDLQLEGADANEESIFDLQDWINREGIRGIRVQRASVPPTAGEMGAEWAETLSVVGQISAPVLVELVKSAFGWFGMRRPDMKIKLRIGPNIVEIETSNSSNEQEIIEKVTALANELGR